MRRFGGLKKLAMLGILAGIAGALYAGGAFERLGDLDGLRAMIAGAGPSVLIRGSPTRSSPSPSSAMGYISITSSARLGIV